MENEELRDILLDKDDEIKGKKTKKILIYAAIFINIFLVVVVAMKFINSSDNPAQSQDGDSRLATALVPLPSQTGAQNKDGARQQSVLDPAAEPKKAEGQLFEQVPIVTEESKQNDEFDDMINKLKEKEKAKAAPKEEVASDTKSAAKPKDTKTAQPASKTEPKKEVKSEQAQKEKTQAKDDKKAEAKQGSKIEQPKQEAKTTEKEPEKSAAKPQSASLGGGTYIQVTAVSKFDPNNALIAKLKAQGYGYQTVKVGEMTKVLVGPFESGEVAGKLDAIRKNINSGAFIYRAK